MVTLQFKNALDEALTLIGEPWAGEDIIPAGSMCTIRYPSATGRPVTSFLEWHRGSVVFSCEGDDYEVYTDGERVT